MRLRQLVLWSAVALTARGEIAEATLPPLPIVPSSTAVTAINANGQVVGSDAHGHAFIWSAAKGLTDLGTLGGNFSAAYALNDSGQVVGSSTLPGEATSHAFFWTAAGGMVDIGTLGGPSSFALGINASGQVIGSSDTSANGPSHGFLWTAANGIIDLGALGSGSQALAINDNGQIVGDSDIPTTGAFTLHAFVWTAADGMIDLGTLGGSDSHAAAINAHGQVVGRSLTAQNSTSHAFLWSAESGMVDLGSLGGESGATAINDVGEVTGVSSKSKADSPHAFVWTPLHGMIDLGTLGGNASVPVAINNAGQVVGQSHGIEGQSHPFLWTPNTGMVAVDTAPGYAVGENDAGAVIGLVVSAAGPSTVMWPAGTTQDLLWQNDATRQVTNWHMGGMQGIARLDWGFVSASGVPSWKIVGTADFDGDGHADIVWQHDTTRQVVVWFMGGSQDTTMVGWDYASSVDIPGWTVVAMADLNGDGHPDLIWQNDVTRQLTVFYMGGAHGTTRLGWSWLSQTGVLDWSVVAVRDFDGDGHPDLVWQNDTTRQVTVWYMGGPQGTTFLSWTWLAQVGVPGWKIVGSRDFDGDGHADLAWQNDSTRAATVWYMGGPQGATLRGWNWLSVSVPGWTLIGR